ncbi:MAG: ParB/RepB/Spo0J family partition protein [Pedosphaera sp.]|nr:ParB/RepB/Spo0J family partition protein [Pedosphaera sp.]
MSKPALGRGLGALLGGGAKPPTAPSVIPSSSLVVPIGSVVRRVSRDRVRPSPLQPRKNFTPESLTELADSIREQGIIQPLVVRPSGEFFELIAGERRWRAAGLAGLTEVPVIERLASDSEVLELALIENLQRENLNPVEEALGYRQLQGQFSLTQDEIARKVGRGRVVVANALRLLKLPEAVLIFLREGRISVGHSKVILGLENGVKQESIARRVIELGLSVRQTEEAVAAEIGLTKSSKITTATPPSIPRDPHVVDLENRIREKFGMRIGLQYKSGKGRLEVHFHSDDELDRVLEIIGVTVD